MNKSSLQIKKELEKHIKPEKVAILSSFFKTGKGEYGERDKFLGITVPSQRLVAKAYREVSFEAVKELLESEYHEHRLTGFLILTYKFEKAEEKEKKAIFDFYYKHRKYANNWDLVDLSAYKIMGEYLLNKKRDVLYKLAQSKGLWDRRIAMVSCFAFIRKHDFEDVLKIAEILVQDKHDLIQKAVGWMLREVGKRDADAERGFLRQYEKVMPRVMWRYAVEKGMRP